MTRKWLYTRLLLAAGGCGLGTLLYATTPVTPTNTVASAPQVSPAQASLELTKAEVALLGDPITMKMSLQVSLDNNTIVLAGKVADDAARRKALEVARQSCYLPIRDQLTVGVQVPGTPTDLKKAARDALIRQLGSKADHLVITSDGEGQIKLSGEVSSIEEKLLASRALRYLPGCSRVVNSLTIRSSSTNGNPITVVSSNGQTIQCKSCTTSTAQVPTTVPAVGSAPKIKVERPRGTEPPTTMPVSASLPSIPASPGIKVQAGPAAIHPSLPQTSTTVPMTSSEVCSPYRGMNFLPSTPMTPDLKATLRPGYARNASEETPVQEIPGSHRFQNSPFFARLMAWKEARPARQKPVMHSVVYAQPCSEPESAPIAAVPAEPEPRWVEKAAVPEPQPEAEPLLVMKEKTESEPPLYTSAESAPAETLDLDTTQVHKPAQYPVLRTPVTSPPTVHVPVMRSMPTIPARPRTQERPAVSSAPITAPVVAKPLSESVPVVTASTTVTVATPLLPTATTAPALQTAAPQTPVPQAPVPQPVVSAPVETTASAWPPAHRVQPVTASSTNTIFRSRPLANIPKAPVSPQVPESRTPPMKVVPMPVVQAPAQPILAPAQTQPVPMPPTAPPILSTPAPAVQPVAAATTTPVPMQPQSPAPTLQLSATELIQRIQAVCGTDASDVRVETGRDNSVIVHVYAKSGCEGVLIPRLLPLPELSARNVKLDIHLAK